MALRRAHVRSTLRPVFSSPRSHAFLTTQSQQAQQQPNAPLDLDPSFKALLRDVDKSLSQHKTRPSLDAKPRELKLLASDYTTADSSSEGERVPQRSPAARFGSQRIGHVVLPEEMQQAIFSMIEATDKDRLHVDAMRLFKDDSTEDANAGWRADYDARYKSAQQSVRHAAADAAAFVSVALPAHYSAIYSVLNEVRNRLGSNWAIDTIYDWGAGTGSALWHAASSHVFHADASAWRDYDTIPTRHLTDSTVAQYVAIEERRNLSFSGRRLLQGVNTGKIDIQWRKSYPEEGLQAPFDGKATLAISAFHLSSLPSGKRRKVLKGMWDSGADVMVIIDHSTLAGFNNVIEARDFFLNIGKSETDDLQLHDRAAGAHVVAPCPHDGECPIYHDPAAGRRVCGFSQRMQRPSFVRHTKHSGTGHEDSHYSYVVVKRGPRPAPAATRVGRVGEVGRREQVKLEEKGSIVELKLHDETTPEDVEREVSADISLSDHSSFELNGQMREMLQHEAYGWPRLVFPPLKRSGHIVLDVCSSAGNIMRWTIPKSQGKQPYYDARKSEWGDIFPHPPKNTPQVRYQPSGWERSAGDRPPWRQDAEGGKDKTKGSAKRPSDRRAEASTSYTKLSKDTKDKVAKEDKAVRRVRRKEEKDAARELAEDIENEGESELRSHSLEWNGNISRSERMHLTDLYP